MIRHGVQGDTTVPSLPFIYFGLLLAVSSVRTNEGMYLSWQNDANGELFWFGSSESSMKRTYFANCVACVAEITGTFLLVAICDATPSWC